MRLKALLECASRRCQTVYILGDLFDQWLGDDEDSPPYLEAESVLAALSDSGTEVFVQRGNHDFLIGEDLEQRIGATLMPETMVIDLDGITTVLTHGDGLCTDDREFQAFRAYALNRENQRWFLSLTREERAIMADKLRLRSAALKTLKANEIMDVNPDAVRTVLATHNGCRLIHGHTHRPAVHRVESTGRPAAERVVLGDWYEEGVVALHRDGQLTLLSVTEAEKMLRR